MKKNASLKIKKYQSVRLSWSDRVESELEFSAQARLIKEQIFLIRAQSLKKLSENFHEHKKQGKYLRPLMEALIGIYKAASFNKQSLCAYVDCSDTMLATWVAKVLYINRNILDDSFLKGIRRARKKLMDLGLLCFASGVNDRATLYGFNFAYQSFPELKAKVAQDSHLSAQHNKLFKQVDPLCFSLIKHEAIKLIKIEKKKLNQEIYLKTFTQNRIINKLKHEHNKIIYENYNQSLRGLEKAEDTRGPKSIYHLLQNQMSTLIDPLINYIGENKYSRKLDLSGSEKSKVSEIKLLISDLENQLKSTKEEITRESTPEIFKLSWGKAVENFFKIRSNLGGLNNYEVIPLQLFQNNNETKKETMQVQSWYRWLADETKFTDFYEVTAKFAIKFMIDKSEIYKPHTVITKEQSAAIYNYFKQKIKLNELMTLSTKNGRIDEDKKGFEEQSYQQTMNFLTLFFQGNKDLIEKIEKLIYRHNKRH